MITYHKPHILQSYRLYILLGHVVLSQSGLARITTTHLHKSRVAPSPTPSDPRHPYLRRYATRARYLGARPGSYGRVLPADGVGT